MTKISTLQTKRLNIIPFQERHLTDRYVSWLNDKNLMRYSEQRHKQHSIESCRKYFETFQKSPHYLWAIEVKRSALGHIGNINAYVDHHNLHADVGILIGEREAHDQGYASEVFGAVVSFLLSQCGIRKVTAGTMAANKPMLRLMKKAGMIEDGVRKRHYLWEGQEMNIVHMARFSDVYLTGRGL